MSTIDEPNELQCWVLTVCLPNNKTITRVSYAPEPPKDDAVSFFKDLNKTDWDALSELLKTDPTAIKISGPHDVPEAEVALVFEQLSAEFISCYSNIPCNITMMSSVTDEEILESDPATTVITFDNQKFATTFIVSEVDLEMVESIISNTIDSTVEEECIDDSIDEINDD